MDNRGDLTKTRQHSGVAVETSIVARYLVTVGKAVRQGETGLTFH